MWTAIPLTSSSAQLALPGVDPGADGQTQRGDALDDVGRAADRPGRAVEGRQKAIAVGLDLVAAPARQPGADQLIVVLELPAPALVADPRQQLRRADDVSEQNRRQHAVDRRRRAPAGQELLDLEHPGGSIQP